jgi:hypothetical protein
MLFARSLSLRFTPAEAVVAIMRAPQRTELAACAEDKRGLNVLGKGNHNNLLPGIRNPFLYDTNRKKMNRGQQVCLC